VARAYFHFCDLANYIWATGPSGKTQRMGLLRDDYTPKPAYHAYHSLCTLLEGQVYRLKLKPHGNGSLDVRCPLLDYPLIITDLAAISG
jgi:hypothetical protein